MHSSLSFLVSGQAQQIFFFGFDSGTDVEFAEPLFCPDPGRAKVEEAFCKGSPPIAAKDQKISLQEGLWRTRKNEENQIQIKE